MVKRFFLKFYLLIILAFLYLPLGVLIWLSFNNSEARTVWGGFTLRWYRQLLEDSEVLSALINTLTIGFLSALTAAVFGTLSALGIYAMRKRAASVVNGFGNLPMLNADIVTGLILMLWFTRFTELGYTSVLLAHITFNIPYVVMTVLPQMNRLDHRVYEAARDLGAGSLSAFFRVVFPDLFPSIASGFFLALTLSMDDFVVTYFTKGAGVDTLSTMIYGQMKRGINPELYALSTAIFAVVLIVLIIMNLVQRERSSNRCKQEFS